MILRENSEKTIFHLRRFYLKYYVSHYALINRYLIDVIFLGKIKDSTGYNLIYKPLTKIETTGSVEL